MTRITLSTGDKYFLSEHYSEIFNEVKRDGWILIEDDGRDIAVRSSHIVAIEEYSDSLLKESIQSAENPKTPNTKEKHHENHA